VEIMRRPGLSLVLAFIVLPGCSSLGAWVYQDPTYVLRSVDVKLGADESGAADSVQLTFIGCNLNDFDITETSFATTLSIGGKSAGPGDHGQTIYLGTRDTSRFSVMVPVHNAALPEGPSAHPFEIKAVSQVVTPIGQRAINVQMAGFVDRQNGQLNWRMKPQGCKPGTSTLPASFDTRPIPPEYERERPQPTRLPGATVSEPR
jgi:hypothetical protein